MKKTIIALALCLALLLGSVPALAAPQEIDLDTMTAEELHALIDQARTALLKYEVIADSDTVLLDQDGAKVTLKGYSFSGTTLKLQVVAENNSDVTFSLLTDSPYVNGWAVTSIGLPDLAPGKKNKGELTFYGLDDAEVTADTDLQEVEFLLKVYDTGSYKAIFTSDVIRVNFPIGPES